MSFYSMIQPTEDWIEELVAFSNRISDERCSSHTKFELIDQTFQTSKRSPKS